MTRRVTAKARSSSAALRAEARLLTTAGMLLLALGFPLTLAMVAWALGGGVSPTAPIVAGGPLILLGYLSCHFASTRLAKANALAPPRRAKRQAKSAVAAGAGNC